jgi:hypothetical protein
VWQVLGQAAGNRYDAALTQIEPDTHRQLAAIQKENLSPRRKGTMKEKYQGAFVNAIYLCDLCVMARK